MSVTDNFVQTARSALGIPDSVGMSVTDLTRQLIENLMITPNPPGKSAGSEYWFQFRDFRDMGAT